MNLKTVASVNLKQTAVNTCPTVLYVLRNQSVINFFLLTTTAYAHYIIIMSHFDM